MRQICGVTCCAIVLTLNALARHSEAGEPGFKRFPETISPNGAYVLAWGWCKDGNLAVLKEWEKGKDNGGGEIENYLVDAVHGRVLARIPGFAFCRSTPGLPPADYHTETHYSLGVGWSPDSREALACYDEYWEGNEVVVIRPATRTFVNVKNALNGAYFHSAAKTQERDPEKSFHAELSAVLPGEVFAVAGWVELGFKTDDEFRYRLLFRLELKGATQRVEIVSKRKVPQAEEAGDEATLRKLYARLYESLDDTGRAVLKKQQEAWLQQRRTLSKRETLSGDDERSVFTESRCLSLRARLGQ